MSAPTPVRVDELAEAYLALKDEYLEARLEAEITADLLEKKGAELKALVSDFGSAHAEKSKLLHGVTHELMVTFGSSVSIDGAC
jgi:hypothetical protein